MENLRLHFSNRQLPDRPLPMGVHRVVREAAGTLGVGDNAQGALLAQVCVDQRGMWLQVANGVRGVHVNGRPVKRMSLLRAGDSIYLDGVELLLRAAYEGVDAVPPTDPATAEDPRVVLRGIGGEHHGRSFPLCRPCLVGRARDATLRIDDPAFAEHHAQLELRGDRVLLRDLGSAEGSLVNGSPVRDALLKAGDQVVFDGRHRFVIEVPWLPHTALEPLTAEPVETPPTEPVQRPLSQSARRWPWLLLAALLLAGALSALLLFGAH